MAVLQILALLLTVGFRLTVVSAARDGPACTRYLGHEAENVQKYVMRRTLDRKEIKGPFKWIKRLNTLRGERLVGQVWDVKRDGEIFGEVHIDPVLRPIRVRNKAGDEVGNCRIAVIGLLACNWPVKGIGGRMHYDDKANTGQVTARRNEGFLHIFSLIRRLNTRGQLWNKDVGNIFGNLKNKTQDSLRRKIVFEGNKDFLDNIRVVIVKHFFRLIPTYTICIATDSPVDLEESKNQALMFASIGATYANAEKMQRLKWTLGTV